MKDREGTRSKAKEEAAKMAQEAAAAAKAAAATAVVAGGVGLVFPPGVAAGTFFGLVAAFFAATSAHEQLVAADPPRDDFQDVSFPAMELNVRVTVGDPLNRESVQDDFLRRQLLFSAATRGLVLSMERYDGALGAGEAAYAERQAEVMLHHAELSAQQLDRMVMLAPVIDAMAWEVHKNASTLGVRRSIEEVRMSYGLLVEHAIADFIRLSSPCLPRDFIPATEEHPIYSSDFDPDSLLSGRLFSDGFYHLLGEMPKTLRSLVAPEPLA